MDPPELDTTWDDRLSQSHIVRLIGIAHNLHRVANAEDASESDINLSALRGATGGRWSHTESVIELSRQRAMEIETGREPGVSVGQAEWPLSRSAPWCWLPKSDKSGHWLVSGPVD
jgi:hypothetical protein